MSAKIKKSDVSIAYYFFNDLDDLVNVSGNGGKPLQWVAFRRQLNTDYNFMSSFNLARDLESTKSLL